MLYQYIRSGEDGQTVLRAVRDGMEDDDHVRSERYICTDPINRI